MGEILITFVKQSSAFNMKKAANRTGINVKIVQTPKELSEMGCSYAISAKRSDMSKLISISRNYRIEYRRVFGIFADISGKKVYSQI